MNDKPNLGRGWRILRRILIGLAVVATLIATFYTEEDWRGKHDWEAYKHKLEAEGEKLDWQAFVPAPVPDSQNFFAAPIFTNMLDGKIVMTPYGNDGGPGFHPDTNRFGCAIYRIQMPDLVTWQHYYRHQTNTDAKARFPVAPQPQTPAKDVLLALSKYDSAIAELRKASLRPYAKLPIPYEEGLSASASALLPDLAVFKRCALLLQLRASAELADGQSTDALDDVKLLFRLNDSIGHSPFLITHLVRIAMMSITIQPIWEGLAEHKWSDEQLVALNAELAKTDFLADYEFAMRGERTFGIATLESMRRKREMISDADSGYVTNKLLSLMPSAFFYQNELAYARMIQHWILPLVNTNSLTVSPGMMRRVDGEVHAAMKYYSPYKVLAVMTIPALDTAAKRFAIAQTSVNLARVACALERYRLAQGEYPESLDALAPQFIAKLPHDIINGQPLHYRRTDDGKFVLYSVGWDETDDGGTVALRRGGSGDLDKGDWVWKY